MKLSTVMRLLGIGGRKSNQGRTSSQGKKRWQHFQSPQVESSDEDGSIKYKPRKSRSLEQKRRGDGASSRHRTTSRGRSEKSEKGYATAISREPSRESVNKPRRSTSHTRPVRIHHKTRSMSITERPISNSITTTETRRRPNYDTVYQEDLCKSPDISLEFVHEKLNDYSSKNRPSNEQLFHRDTLKNTPPRRSTRIPSQPECSKESAFTKWHTPTLTKRSRKKNQEHFVDVDVDDLANHQSVAGSSNVGVQSRTLRSPNGDGLHMDQPTTHTDRLVDVCLMCEAITAAPFLCLQIMFCADDGLLKDPSTTIRMTRTRKNTLPAVIEAVKNKDQASVSVFTRETFGPTGGYLLCGGRSTTARDECSTPETVSDDSQIEEFRFKQKEINRIDTVGIRDTPTVGGNHDTHSQLEEVVKERLISTGKLDKELLKKLLKRMEDNSMTESVNHKSSESPVSEMSNRSEETTDTDVVVVRGSALQGSAAADRVHEISNSQVRPTETVIVPPSLRRLESWDQVSFGFEATNAPHQNSHTRSAQNRSTPASFRTPIEARGKQASSFSSPPDNLRDVRLEAPITHNKSENSRKYVVPDRSTPLARRTVTKALEQGSVKWPGSRQDLISPPSLLQRAESCETSSHGFPKRYDPPRVSQGNTIQNKHAVLD